MFLIKAIKKLIPFNRVVRTLIISDFFLLFGWGLVSPILAIFITERIKGGSAQIVGISVGIYWIVKSLIQVPVAHCLDRKPSEKDDYLALFGGTLIASLVSLGYVFAELPLHVYFLEALHAIGMAFAVPSWAAIFTRHIDKGKEALSWGVENSSLGIGVGVAGIIGGAGAKIFGFVPLFIGVFVFGITASLMFLFISKDLIHKQK